MPQIPGVPDHAASQELPVRYAVEPKVKAASSAGAGAAAVLTPFFVWVTDSLWWGGGEIDVPWQVIGAIGFVVTGVSSLVAGYYARHVDRLPVVE